MYETIEVPTVVVDSVDVMLGYWDRDLRCQFANAAYQIWFGKSRQQLLGSHIKDLLGPLFELNLPYIRAALQGEVQVFEREIPLPDGSIRHSLASYHPDIVDGVVRGFTAQVTDVTKLKRLEFELQEAKQKAERLATHDFLTGLPNRVLLMDRISAAIGWVERSGGMVAVTAIDLDGFKAINDTYGHDAGDEVLKEIARRMSKALRKTDTVTRLGGDEFIFLSARMASMERIEAGVRRLQQAVCQPLHTNSFDFTPSLSLGVAIYPGTSSTAQELLATADQALYQAKREGKSRFVLAG